MEKRFSISALNPSLLCKEIADDLNQFFCVILSCTIFSILITFQDFYSCFSFSLRAILLFFITVRKAWTKGKNENNVDTDANNSQNSLKNSNCGCENVNKEEQLKEDVESMLMDGLTSFCNLNVDRIEDDKTVLAAVSGLFEELEPSFEEIKEAFDIFDENGDGYIDASELKKLIWRMGFSEFSDDDCKKMIVTHDENKDGRIEFREFVKLMEQSFQ